MKLSFKLQDHEKPEKLLAYDVVVCEKVTSHFDS